MAAKEGGHLDLTHPFEGAIAEFEAAEFTDVAFVAFIKCLCAVFFIDEFTRRYSSDLAGVTVFGYVRLITLAIRALNEQPDDSDVQCAAINVILSYTTKYCTFAVGYSRVDVLYKSKALDHILRILISYSTDLTISHSVWCILSAMCRTERTKYIETLGSSGIIDLAIETLKVHGRDQNICTVILVSLDDLLLLACTRGVSVPPYDDNGLVLNLVLTMKRFSSNSFIQSTCCSILEGMLYRFRGIDEIQASSLVTSMVSMGLYELVIAALKSFSTSHQIRSHGSVLLNFICKQYFADQSKPRNTEGCVALAACLSHHALDIQASKTIIDALKHLVVESPASGAKFLISDGLISLGTALEVHLNEPSHVINGSNAICLLCAYPMDQLVGSAEFIQVLRELEQAILPILLQAFKLHMNTTDEAILQNIMAGSISIASKSQREYAELTELVCEAMHLHPTMEALQVHGVEYFSLVGAISK